MRRAKPWYRSEKNAWYVDVGGTKVRLGPHPDDAPKPHKTKSGWNVPTPIMEAFYRVMVADPATLPGPEVLPVISLFDLFLEHSEKHHSAQTFTLYRYKLQSFCTFYPRLLTAEVKPFHVTRWLDANPTWKGSRRHAIAAVKRAFSWGVDEGLIPAQPLRAIKLPPINVRTRVLTKEEQKEIMGSIRDPQFREFMQTLFETGARPSEVAGLTAEQVDLNKGVWTLMQHKTKAKTRKPRVIYLTPAMVELSTKLIAQYPEGPLFRAPLSKKAFTRNNIRCRFARLRQKLPHIKHFVCYNARHTFATQALVNGVGVAQVAELLGHTSTEMVSKTYGHLADQINHMREAAKKAVG